MITRLRNLIQHNLPAKLLALFVAVILWGYVMNEQNPATEGTYTVAVNLVNQPSGFKITQDTNNVKVKVRGSRSMFVNYGEDDFKATVDLKDAQDGKNACKVNVEVPQGFEIVDISPDKINVTLDKIIQKNVRADISVNGSPAAGVTVAKVTQAYDQVTIEGPESAVKDVDRVIGYVGLNGSNTSDFSLQVPLTAINEDGREVQGITIRPTSMYVSVQLVSGLTKKTVPINPVLGKDLSSSLMLVSNQVDPQQIEISGSAKILDGISSLDTDTIPLADVTKNMDKTVKLILPNGVTVQNDSVTVHLVVRPKSSGNTSSTIDNSSGSSTK